MTLYSVRPNKNQKVFRIFSYGSIGLMLIFLSLSQSAWLELNDRISHAIGWSAMGLLIVFMGGVFVLIAKESAQRAWQKYAFDLADQKIVRVSEDSPPIGLLLTEITFLGESRIGLIVRGGDPLRAFVIPRAISDFEEVKQQLSAHCKVTPVKIRTSLRTVLPLILAIVAYAFLFIAKTGVVVLIAGVVALLFQGWAVLSTRKIWAKTRSPKAIMLAFLVSWLVLAWLVYQRVLAGGIAKSLGQATERTLLLSHDRIDGPFGGEYHGEDLQLFEDGKVIYVEEGTKTLGGRPEHSTYEATIGSDEMRHLTEILDSPEIRSLPKKVSPKTRPIDFFWQKSLEISRRDKTQKIQIENFYPFLNLHGPVYPNALIELECSLQDIKAAAKQERPRDEGDWCKALVNKIEPLKADCKEDEAQPKIVAGEGWGLVRIGTASDTVDAFLGKGQMGRRYSDVYFKDYLAKGIQVWFGNTSNTVHHTYFYNHQRDSMEFGVFCGAVDKGISWRSSAEEVKKIYGQPTAEFSGTDSGGTWKRLVFPGIDFRFENEKMVRIGIPGN
jgi:hypothetical protein